MAVTTTTQAQRAAQSAMASPAWRDLHGALLQTVETMRAGAATISLLGSQMPSTQLPWPVPWTAPPDSSMHDSSSAQYEGASGGSTDSPHGRAGVIAVPPSLAALAQSMRRAHSSPAAPGSPELPAVRRPAGWDGVFLDDIARRTSPAAMGGLVEGSGPPRSSRSPPGSPQVDIASLNAALSKCEDSEPAAHAILASMPAGALSRSGLTKLISKQHKAGNWSKALNIFTAARRLGCSMDLPVFNTALGACEAGRDPERALQIFGMLKDSGIAPDAISFKAVVTTVARANDWQACVRILLDICKEKAQVEAVTCLSLIGVFTRQGSWRLAELVFLAFFRHTHCFSALEDLAAAGGDAARAATGDRDALAEAEEEASDVLTIGSQSLITGHDLAMPASTPEATQVGEAMQLPPPVRTSSAPALRINLFAPEGSINWGVATTESTGPPSETPHPAQQPAPGFAVSSPFASTRLPWSSLPENVLGPSRRRAAPARGGGRAAMVATTVTPAEQPPPEAAARKHELLPVHEDPMARVCCNALLRAYSAAAPLQWPRMIALVVGMTKAGSNMAPDIVSYNSLLSGLVALQQTPRAFELLETISREGLGPTAASHRILLHGAVAAGLHERAEQAWAGLVQAQSDITITDVNAALCALIQLGRWPEAWATYQSVTKPPLSLGPTAETLATLAEPLRQAPAAAETCTQLLADAQVARVALPQAALEALLTHLGADHRWDDAVAFVRVALRREGPVVLRVVQHLAGLMQRAAAEHERAGGPASGHGLQNAYRQVLALYRSATS